MADSDARLARMEAKLDGFTLALGMMRTEVSDGFRELTRLSERHEERDDERFEHARISTEVKFSEVYQHIDTERRHLATRAWQAASVVIGALGAFAGVVFGVIPYLMGKK